MWLRNDYSRGLFNGLIGQVKSIPESPEERWLNVLFDGESSCRRLQLDDLMDLTLAPSAPRRPRPPRPAVASSS